MNIEILSQNIVNQIAAGEVVERPFSVIKELIENAIDACADEIEIHVIDAGKNLISISDNGKGMDKISLEKCILSHATSKLSSKNLFDIHTFGFRGEALPSIASISRMQVMSSDSGNMNAWKLNIEGNIVQSIEPCSRKRGTTVHVKDLFFATPARLKFLKSNNSEFEQCITIINRIALAFPHISFKFFDQNNLKFHYLKTDDIKHRIKDIFGETFVENLFYIDVSDNNLHLKGYIGVPTFNKSTSLNQLFFVNNRLIKDKNFSIAIKAAYCDVIPNGRYPVVILFLEIPSEDVDVNVHPAKTEVRFRDNELMKKFLISSVKKSINNFGGKIATTSNVISMFNIKNNKTEMKCELERCNKLSKSFATSEIKQQNEYYANNNWSSKASVVNDIINDKNIQIAAICTTISPMINADNTNAMNFQMFEQNVNKKDMENIFGNAIAQIDNAYIVSQIDDGFIIVDQHAVAERIMLENLMHDNKLKSQTLLLPEVCNLTFAQVEKLEKNKDLLNKLGIYYSVLSQDIIVVKGITDILIGYDVKKIIEDLVEDLSVDDEASSINDKIHKICSTIACHNSLRAGTNLSMQEMNHLLKQMENIPNIAQCCHGRPSYIKFSLKMINNLFERG